MSKPNKTVAVWGRLVRALHWLLAGSVIAAWFAGHLRFDDAHELLGYVAGAVVALRLVWGWRGERAARFASFVRAPKATLAYARLLLRSEEPRYLGHNPLGGWMVVALLACAGLASFTGFLYTTDWLWGYGWLAAIHIGLSWLMAGLVVLHLAGVIFTSLRHRENLVRAMITGQKPAGDSADAGDV